MAIVLLVLAIVVTLAVSAVVGPYAVSPWLRALFLASSSALPFLIALLGWRLLRRRLVGSVADTLIDIAGPGMVRSMPPRVVLDSLLPTLYGAQVRHDDVVNGILGGPGLDVHGGDTVVSRRTTAEFRIQAIDEFMALSESTWTHEFSGVRDNHRLVFFGTSDRRMAPSVMRDRKFPLFEIWILEDDEELEEFVRNLRSTLRVGVTYSDENGERHTVDPREHRGEEVAHRQFGRYLTLPEHLDRQNLRIVQLDLWDLTDDDHVVGAIENLSIKVSVVSSIDLGYVRWSAPYPCYLESVVFDVRELRRAQEEFVFRVVPSILRLDGISTSTDWVKGDEKIEVQVESWVLPGHGVTLLWRPADGVEPVHASRLW